MLTLTERAQQQLKVALADGDLASARLRVFIDHRCHCGKAHFSLALEEEPAPAAVVAARRAAPAWRWTATPLKWATSKWARWYSVPSSLGTRAMRPSRCRS